MNSVIVMIETPLAKPLHEVMAVGARLQESSLPFEQQPPEVRDQLAPRNSSTASIDNDAIRTRLADVARQEEKRRCLLKILQRPTPVWNPADHPELEGEGGAAAWVKELRREAEQAFEKRTRVRGRE